MSGLVVEAHALQGPRRRRGIGRYVRSLLPALHDLGQLEAVLFNPKLGPPPTRDTEVPHELWLPNDRATRRLLARSASSYLVTSPFELGYGPSTALPVGTEELFHVGMVVYDLIPFRFPEHYLENPIIDARHHGHLAVMTRAETFLAISEATRRDLLDEVPVSPSKVVNIGAGVPTGFGPPSDGALLAADAHLAVPQITRPYVLCVAAFEWRKNVLGLLEAWALLEDSLRRRNQLVIACELLERERRVWDRAARDLGITESVVFTGETSDAQLLALYQGTKLFVFPSRYEGFGFPPFEAMVSGAPALVGANSSLLELVAPEATFDVEDPADIGRALARGMTDAAFLGRLRASADEVLARNTWDGVADRVVTAMAVGGPRPARGWRGRPLPQPTRLALVGPFLPSPTGVGVYNTRLLRSLVEHADVDCFIEGDRRVAEVAGARALPIESLGEAFDPRSYDGVVFVLGNSRHHIDTYDALLREGGVGWFHDVNLVGLHRERAERFAPHRIGDYLADAFRRCYERAPRRPPALFDHDEVASDGFFLAAEAARATTSTIVSSSLAATMLANDVGRRLRPTPLVIPHAFPDVQTGPEVRPLEHGRPVVVSLGNVHEVKRPATLVEAIARIPSARRPLLVFAGADTLRDREAFTRRVAALGLDDDVLVTGWLDDREYWEWLATASAVVQLRDLSYGEASGAVAEAMAMGRAVITSVAACADFPAGVHVQLDESADADQLATVIERVLADDEWRQSLEAAAREYAASWSYRHVAERLLGVVMERQMEAG